MEQETVDVTHQPLTERLRLLTVELRELADPRFQLAEEVGWALDRDSVMRLKEEAVARDYEGVVVKPAKSTYYGMPWLKLKKHNTQDLVVLAVKKTKSWLDHRFPAAFLVGHFHGAGYKADGVVSSGLSSQDKARIGARVDRLKWREDQDFVWITPSIVVEVQYTGLVQGSFREPRMLRIRSDKTPQQCLNPPLFGERMDAELGDRRLTPLELRVFKNHPGQFKALRVVLSRNTEPTLFELAISELAAKMDAIFDLVMEALARTGWTREQIEAFRKKKTEETAATWPRTSLFLVYFVRSTGTD